MKIAIWSYSAAVTFAAIAVAGLGWAFRDILDRTLFGKPLPPLTWVLIEHFRWGFAIPIPWILVAIVLTRGRTIAADRCLAFAGVSTAVISFLFMFVAIALSLPYIRIITPLQ